MHSRLTWFLFLLASLLAPLTSQDDPKFTLAATFEPAVAKPGDSVKLVLQATTMHGWHAYGTMETVNVPVSLDTAALQLTGFELAGPAVIPSGSPKFTPIGTSYPLPETFKVVVPLKVSAGATARKVEGVLGYQICDASMCERPNEAAFVAQMASSGEGGGAAKPEAQLPESQQPAGQQPAGQQPGSAGKPEPVSGLGTAPGLRLDVEKVTIRASFDPPTVRAGEVTTLVLDVDVIEGWHAYGTLEMTNVPVGLDPLKQDTGDLEFEGEAIVPPGIEKPTPVGPTYPLPHHFQVKQHMRVPVGTEPGTIDVTAVLDYQICDEGGCENPTEGDAAVTLTVEAGEARAERAEVPQDTVVAGTEPDETDSGAGAANESVDPEEEDKKSWWLLILASIGGGLFALAMPCTYPMIPITFSFFTKQAEKRGGSVLGLTIVYGLGIIAMFVAVGVLLSAVIIDVVNHWVTNTIIGLMFFFFAFVLFGWVNLNPPQFLNKLAYKAQGSAASGGGSGGLVGLLMALLGVFFMGATLVITSFTCTAPIVGTLIANVASEGLVRVGVGMAIFGLTMAIPFMALSLMPGKVKSMPKSGEWMETLKISLGFVELAAAFKFVSMVDFAFGWQALPRELFLMLWAAIFGLWAMFLFGILRKAGTVNEGVSNGRLASGMLVTLLAAYFFFGAMGNRLDKIMTSFIPNYSNSMVSTGDGGHAKASSKHILVYDDPDAAIARAKQEGKLLLYNFTGFN